MASAWRDQQDPYAFYNTYNPDKDDYDCRIGCCTLAPPKENPDDIVKWQVIHLRSRISKGGDSETLEHYCKVITSLGGEAPELKAATKNRSWSEAQSEASTFSGGERLTEWDENASPCNSTSEAAMWYMDEAIPSIPWPTAPPGFYAWQPCFQWQGYPYDAYASVYGNAGILGDEFSGIVERKSLK